MINTVTIAGNLTRDTELKYTNNGTAVLKGSVAVNEKYKGEEKTHYFNFTILGKFAESINQYLVKGTPVALTGRLQHNRWQDKDGNTRSDVGILVQDLQMFGTKSASGGAPSQSGGDSFEDDLPF